MNLKNWTKNHTYGLMIGIISPLIFIPLVILMLSWIENFQFSQLMSKFMDASIVRSKIISIAIISNLIWFYLSLNREKWGLAMGIIVATMLFLPYILYVNFML
jgi:hypothetical protein